MKQPPIKTKELSGSTVQIADGQNWEIASITAYGENAQGGTTETPVALTGISSVTVNDDVTELPIPRPLRVWEMCGMCAGHGLRASMISGLCWMEAQMKYLSKQISLMDGFKLLPNQMRLFLNLRALSGVLNLAT